MALRQVGVQLEAANSGLFQRALNQANSSVSSFGRSNVAAARQVDELGDQARQSGIGLKLLDVAAGAAKGSIATLGGVATLTGKAIDNMGDQARQAATSLAALGAADLATNLALAGTAAKVGSAGLAIFAGGAVAVGAGVVAMQAASVGAVGALLGFGLMKNIAADGGELKKEINELTTEMAKLEKAGKTNTAEYAKMQKELNKLKDEYATTFTGMIDTTKGWFSETAQILSQPIFDALKPQMAKLTEAFKNVEVETALNSTFDTISEAVDRISLAFAGAFNPVSLLVSAFGKISSVVDGFSKGLVTAAPALMAIGGAVIRVSSALSGPVVQGMNLLGQAFVSINGQSGSFISKTNTLAGIMQFFGRVMASSAAIVGGFVAGFVTGLGPALTNFAQQMGMAVINAGGFENVLKTLAGGALVVGQAVGNILGSILRFGLSIFQAGQKIGVFTALFNGLQTVASVIGSVLATVAAGVNRFADAFKSGDKLAQFIFTFANGFEALAIGVALALPIITTIGAAIAFLLNPIGLIIVAGAGLASAWQTNFGGVRDIVDALGQAFLPLTRAVENFVKGVLATRNAAKDLADAFAPVKSSIKITGDVYDEFGNKISSQYPIIDNLGNFVRTTLVPAFNDLAPKIFSAANAIGPLIGKAIELYAQFSPLSILFSVISGAINGGFIGAFDALEEKVISFGDLLGVDLYPAMENIQAFITGPLLNAFNNIGTFITATLLPAVQSFAGWLGQQLGPIITSLASNFQTTILPALQTFGNFIGAVVIPKIMELGTFLFTTLKPAFEAVFSFISTTVIPVFSSIVAVILGTVIPTIVNLVSIIATVLQPVFTALVEFFTGVLLPALTNVGNFIMTTVIPAFTNVWNFINANVMPILQTLAGFLAGALTVAFNVIGTVASTVWNAISGTVSTVWGILSGIFNTLVSTLGGPVSGAFNAISNTVSTVWNAISGFISGAWGTVQGIFQQIQFAINGPLSAAFAAIKNTVSQVWDNIKSFISSAWGNIQSTFDNIVSFLSGPLASGWNKAKETVTQVWDGIKTAISTAWNGAKSTLDTAVSFVTGTFTTTWNNLKTAVSSVWDGIVSGIGRAVSDITTKAGDIVTFFTSLPGKITDAVAGFPGLLINAGRNLIQGLISGIRSLNIPLPHVNVTFSTAQAGPISIPVPNFSVDWYAKGGIFNAATLAGIGEAGPEAVVPLSPERFVPLFAKVMREVMPGRGSGIGAAIRPPASAGQIYNNAMNNASYSNATNITNNYNLGVQTNQSTGVVVQSYEMMRLMA